MCAKSAAAATSAKELLLNASAQVPLCIFGGNTKQFQQHILNDLLAGSSISAHANWYDFLDWQTHVLRH